MKLVASPKSRGRRVRAYGGTGGRAGCPCGRAQLSGGPARRVAAGLPRRSRVEPRAPGGCRRCSSDDWWAAGRRLRNHAVAPSADAPGSERDEECRGPLGTGQAETRAGSGSSVFPIAEELRRSATRRGGRWFHVRRRRVSMGAARGRCDLPSRPGGTQRVGSSGGDGDRSGRRHRGHSGGAVPRAVGVLREQCTAARDGCWTQGDRNAGAASFGGVRVVRLRARRTVHSRGKGPGRQRRAEALTPCVVSDSSRRPPGFGGTRSRAIHGVDGRGDRTASRTVAAAGLARASIRARRGRCERVAGGARAPTRRNPRGPREFGATARQEDAGPRRRAPTSPAPASCPHAEVRGRALPLTSSGPARAEEAAYRGAAAGDHGTTSRARGRLVRGAPNELERCRGARPRRFT